MQYDEYSAAANPPAHTDKAAATKQPLGTERIPCCGKRFTQRLTPVLRLTQSSVEPPLLTEHAVRRPRRRPRKSTSGRRQHSNWISTELFKDRLGETKPRGVASVGVVVDAG